MWIDQFGAVKAGENNNTNALLVRVLEERLFKPDALLVGFVSRLSNSKCAGALRQLIDIELNQLQESETKLSNIPVVLLWWSSGNVPPSG